ncbi:hypothetical protein RRG08_058093 [Elysia crispata]|uniref:Uncharacterized protein n=1 Tax=Elysia crispata TaxID=231223 RepID=A0AAE0YI90_9GAST|nr:hypothetical protein RRG08_058093 [Elysia crispata]
MGKETGRGTERKRKDWDCRRGESVFNISSSQGRVHPYYCEALGRKCPDVAKDIEQKRADNDFFGCEADDGEEESNLSQESEKYQSASRRQMRPSYPSPKHVPTDTEAEPPSPQSVLSLKILNTTSSQSLAQLSKPLPAPASTIRASRDTSTSSEEA